MADTLPTLQFWTKARIDSECGPSYRRYERALIEHYTAYYAARPQARCRRQRYSARTIAEALPPGYAGLQQLIPPAQLHRFARSGRSSQILGLALLGAAAEAKPSLQWFWRAFGLSSLGQKDSSFVFEHALAPTVLNEHPHVTQIDFTVSNALAFAAVEVKLSEPSFGACSCARDGDGNPNAGFDCSARVRQRKMYWRVAHDCFGLNEVRLPLLPCSLSLAYQPIRITAAAHQLAGNRMAVCGLIYDDRNPFFRKTGSWPGWPEILRNTFRTEPGNSIFRAISWQRLLLRLPLSAEIRLWAWEKHRLGNPVH